MTIQLFNTTAEIKHKIETREARIGIVSVPSIRHHPATWSTLNNGAARHRALP